MTATTDTEVLEHLDFTPDHKCEANDKPCHDTAKWLAIHGCCGATAEFCRFHASVFQGIITRAKNRGRGVVCHLCKTYSNPPALYRVVKLP